MKAFPTTCRATTIIVLISATLPTFAQGWTLTTAPATNGWTAIASSADGRVLVACSREDTDGGAIYVSTNSGASWTFTSAPTNGWSAVAASAHGARLLAAFPANGGLWTSPDSGLNWSLVPTVPATNAWAAVSCSADGKKWGAADGGGNHWYGRAFVSTNEGTMWKDQYTDGQRLGSIASSSDGTRWIVPGLYGVHFTSQDSGQTWATNSPPAPGLNDVASSADGSRLLAAGSGLYTSTNFGTTWLPVNTPVAEWTAVASSANGKRLVAVARNQPIYTSTNAGVSWETNGPVKDWQAVASSADGCKLAAVAFHSFQVPGGIYTLKSDPAPRLNATLSGGTLKLSWIVPSVDMVLQQSTSLATPDWVNVNISPTLNYATLSCEVPIPNSAGTLFFRLALRESAN